LPPFKMKIQKYKGTRDFYPKEKQIQNYIFNTWRSIAKKYGYEEIDGPLLEPLELFTQKSGEEIKEQLYTLKDKSNRKLALRPETTPTIARMIAQNKSLPKPIRWFSISRCFRYERSQTGRLREFFQFNLDLLGTESMKADAEVIATLARTMQEFGCTKKDFYIRINNRKIMNSLFKNLKIKNTKQLYNLIDKKSKISQKEFDSGLKELKLTKEQIKNINEILKINSIKQLRDYNMDTKEIEQLFDYLKYYNIQDLCKLDLTIVRGLDYYTSTVFELSDAKNEFRALAGGGRYDNLVDIFGGEKCPGIGYGMGDVVLELFLKKQKKLPDLTKQIDYFIIPINAEKQAIELSEKLRKKYNVELSLSEKNISKQLNYANSLKVSKVIFIGEREIKQNKVKIRDMKTGKEKLVSIKDV